MRIIKKEAAEEMVVAADVAFKELGFVFTFICAGHINDKNSLNFPFVINFDEELLAQFLYNLLNMEEYKELKEDLLSKFGLVKREEGIEDFVKFVKL